MQNLEEICRILHIENKWKLNIIEMCNNANSVMLHTFYMQKESTYTNMYNFLRLPLS